MDKLKKWIFITFFWLLIAGTAELCLLLTNVLRQNKFPAEPPAQIIPATEPNQLPAGPTPVNTADVPLTTNPTPVTPEETEGPCENALLPPDSPQNLTCRWGDKGFCAFFDNGRPFFCRTKNAQTRYKLNRWGTSVTVTQKTPLGQPLSERYYANDKLARATDYDAKNNLVTQVWFDGNNSFRLTQTDNNGKVLDKYYFHTGKPYVRYPGGNDMGEINGQWELKNEQIFTDGKPLYTLPGPKIAPDVCMIFNGYCSLPTMPYPKNELPAPDILLPETQKDSR